MIFDDLVDRGTYPAVIRIQTSIMLFCNSKPNQPKPIRQVKSGCVPVKHDLIQILFSFGSLSRIENISIISNGDK